MGGDTSGKTSESAEETTTTSTQDVWGGQSDFLTDLYGQGAELSADPSVYSTAAQETGADYAGDVTGDVYDPLTDLFSQAFGADSAYGTSAEALTDPLISGLSSLVAGGDENYFQQGSNELLDAYAADILSQSSTNLLENVIPGITRDETAMGQYGGSRGELAIGTAVDEANADALSTVLQLYSDQYAGDVAAGLESQAQADATQLAAAQQISDLFAGETGAVTEGIEAGAGLTDLGMSESDILGSLASYDWDALLNQLGLLGDPTVLGVSETTGVSSTDPIFFN